ncbi:SDR family oxidoreductase [Nesterenkonia populi]
MRIAVIGHTGVAGQAVSAAARKRGHEVAGLSRGEGVDVVLGAGLAEAFQELDALVDVSGAPRRSALSTRKALRFFRPAAENLLRAAGEAGVRHVVRLSIVGADRNPHGIYAGLCQMEKLYRAAPVPSTVLRASQFHEFAAQTLESGSLGPWALAPRGRIQPAAVREVGERLIDLAEGPALGRAADFAGPQEEDLSEMVRLLAQRAGRRRRPVPVSIPGKMMRGVRDGLNLPGSDAELGEQTFAEWLEEQ